MAAATPPRLRVRHPLSLARWPTREEAAQARWCSPGRYCEGLDQRHKQVTCRLWDRDFAPDDRAVRLASDGRRRLDAPSWRLPARSGEESSRFAVGESRRTS